jgi:hypothetical protein
MAYGKEVTNYYRTSFHYTLCTYIQHRRQHKPHTEHNNTAKIAKHKKAASGDSLANEAFERRALGEQYRITFPCTRELNAF